MRSPVLASIPMALLAVPGVAGEALRVSPGDSLAAVGRRLASDPAITEVVLEGGVYKETLVIPPPPRDAARGSGGATPLLVRPAEGARVVFDGAVAIPEARAVKDRPGVYWFAHRAATAEPPKLWEPGSRTRYTLAADLAAVERFAASCLLLDGRIYFHTADGLPPGRRVILLSALDSGVVVNRPDVTVRDLDFRNFVARGKGSSGVRINADRVTVERCGVSNASFGFIVRGHQGAIMGCTARDVGGGVYVHGNDARIEGCRFFKERDAFMVPGYPQDDCAIQFYYPAEGGVARGNLAVGFGIGILIKTPPAPWVVERNTLVGRGLENGFLSTNWHPEEIFRRNIVADYALPIQTPQGADLRGVERNCYWPTIGPGRPAPEPGSVVGDPRFVDPAGEDYRLDPGSACLEAAGGNAEIGALAVAPREPDARRAPREWHVSPSAVGAPEGTGEAPLRTLQAAVDRAGPGDTILLHPGIYSESVRITRGGEAGRPITLRAIEKGTAILDGDRRLDALITIEKAPFVVIRDLEIRWYRSAGIRLQGAHDVTVSGCRIWNAHWGGTWPTAAGVHVEGSLRFRGERNVVYSNEYGFYLISSPQATITRNTAVNNLYGAALFIHSIEGSVCRNNSFAFQGNDAISIVEGTGGKDRLASFDCDYNNYGMTIQDQAPGVAVDRIAPREADRQLVQTSKAIVYFEESPAPWRRFLTLQEWRDFSSLDRHSIAADPLFVSSATHDFRPERRSPNIGAGEGGVTLGAYD
jgi:parallel beta-helix repeat protein